MYTSHATRSHVTTDHRAIQEWVESRGGAPARVKGTGTTEDAGFLRIAFNRETTRLSNLEPISWQEFFETFERNRLAFLYQEEILAENNSYAVLVNEDVAKEPESDEDDAELNVDADNGIEKKEGGR